MAPHHDDVEIFVVQTEGAKRWSIYPPASGSAETCELANSCSGDLDEQELDQPLMEFILEVGDVERGGCWWRMKAWEGTLME